MDSFRDELISLLNRHGLETGSNTPDFVLADYLLVCLSAFDVSTNRREEWYGRPPSHRKGAGEVTQ